MSYSSTPAGLVAIDGVGGLRLRWPARLVALAAGGMLLALLVTASQLTANAAGLGTHQQLGLPPCTVLDWFGVRCPSCGMTTSWAHITHGRVLAATQANAGGALLAMVAAICGPWLVGSGLLGRWLMLPPREGWVLGVGLTIIVVTLLQWTLRVALGW